MNPTIAYTCEECDKSMVRGKERIAEVELTDGRIIYLCMKCFDTCAARARNE